MTAPAALDPARALLVALTALSALKRRDRQAARRHLRSSGVTTTVLDALWDDDQLAVEELEVLTEVLTEVLSEDVGA